MANYQQTTTAIKSQIKTNGNREISGQILQNVLNAIVNNLKQGYLLVGIATPDGNPGTPDQDVCWLATKGTYVNYGNITVGNGKLAVIKYNGTWTYDTVDVQGAVKSGDGITIDPESGEVSVKVGDGLQITGGKVAAKVGDGMQIADGNIAANVGDGLQISGGKVTANLGNGLKKDENGRTAIDLIAGSYVNIENGNKINCTLDTDPFYVVDELPEAPPEGLKNKLWLVPVSGQTAVDLYKWNEETSQFDKVGTITLDVNTALFVKKGKNDITEPLELDAEESIGLIGEMLVLRNKSGYNVGLGLILGADATLSRAIAEPSLSTPTAYLRLAKNASSGKLTLTIACGRTFIYIKDSGTIEMNIPTISEKMPIRPSFYIVCPSGQYWDNPDTFSISGIYSKLKKVLDLNADVFLTYPSRKTAIETDLQHFEDRQDIVMTYRFSSLRFVLTIKSDDSMTIVKEAYIWRFNATNYGINAWYNASGTNQKLYNDLSKLINGTNNVDGILGYLCDKYNVFAITNINRNPSSKNLMVGFSHADAFVVRVLQVKPNGDYGTLNSPLALKLFANDYKISSWPTANGSAVNLYNDVEMAHDNGAQVILIDGSESDKGNEYSVSEFRNIGTGYQLFYESNGSQYILTINSDGSMSTVCNTFSAIDIGVDTFYPTSNESYSGLTDFAKQFIRLAQSGIPVFLKTKNNKISKSEDVLVPIMNVILSSGSVTAYYLKVESTRIGRFSIRVTSDGSVTISTLGS